MSYPEEPTHYTPLMLLGITIYVYEIPFIHKMEVGLEKLYRPQK